jgi:hypothetical protein
MDLRNSALITFVRTLGNTSGGGYVLLSALVITGILFVVSAGLINYSNSYSKLENLTVAEGQALQLAEAGIDKAVYELNESSLYSGETLTLPGGQVVISVSNSGASDKRITATGYVPNSTSPAATRAVKATATIGNTSIAFHYGVQVGEGGFVMDGGSIVNGSIYSNGNIHATNGVEITGGAIAANPASTSTDQANDTPIPISSCTGSTCVDFGTTNGTQDFAQSFQISDAERMNSVEFYIKKTSTPGNLTVRIVNDNAGSPGTDTIMSATLNASLVTTSFNWVRVTLPTTPLLDPGQTYWIVLDGSSNATRYYTIGANSSYGNGSGKIGRYSSTWSDTSPSGLDGYFRIYLGGGSSYIGGDNGAWGAYVGTTGSDNAWAYEVKGVTVSGANQCQIGTGNNKACDTSQGIPPAAAMPISDGNIQDWKDDAAAGTVTTGNVTVGWAGSTRGPEKIVGNLTVNGGGILTLTGTLWVTGSVTVTGGGQVKLSSTYASNQGALIADGPVTINGGASFSGSGSPGSYPFLITTSSCPADPGCSGAYAIDESGGAGTVALVAQNGTVRISGGSNLKAVTARQIYMTGGASLTYDSGLINANFYSGPGGSYNLVPGTYVISQ